MNSLGKLFGSMVVMAYAEFSQAVSLFDETQAERLRLSDQECKRWRQKALRPEALISTLTASAAP